MLGANGGLVNCALELRHWVLSTLSPRAGILILVFIVWTRNGSLSSNRGLGLSGSWEVLSCETWETVVCPHAAAAASPGHPGDPAL